MATRALKLVAGILTVLLLALCGRAPAATIVFTSTNSLGQPDTNFFRVIPVGDPILANGSVITKGIGLRLLPNTNGIVSANLMLGNYLWTNAFLGSGIIIAVPDATNTFNAADLAISGFNTYNYKPGVMRVASANGTIAITPSTGLGSVDLAVIGAPFAGLNQQNTFTQPNFFQGLTSFRGDTFISGSTSIGTGKALWWAGLSGGHTNALAWTADPAGSSLNIWAGTNMENHNWFTGGGPPVAAPVAIQDGIIYANLAGSSNAIPGGSAGGILGGSFPNPGFGSFSSLTFRTGLTDPNGSGPSLFSTGDGGGLTALNLSSLSNIPPHRVVGNFTGSSASGMAGQVTESEQSLSDLTTLNASASQHGYLKKLSGNLGDLLNGLGNFAPFVGVTNASNGSYWFIDLANNAVGVIQASGYRDVWTNGVEYVFSATNTVTVNNLSAVTNVNAQSYSYTPFATANLPSNLSAGSEAYATDVVTPTGSGLRVYYDGANWRLNGWNIIATADPVRFITNCVEASSPFQSRATDFRIEWEPNGGTALSFVRFPLQNGAGAGSGTLALNATYGDYSYITAGSAANGWSMNYGVQEPAMAANWYFACGGNYYVSATPVAADQWWNLVGMTSTVTTNFPTDGVFFIYDQATNTGPVNTFIQGLAGAAKTATNNWICCTAAASSYTFKDSGLPIANNTPSTPNRLGVVYTNGAALFFTNGALSQTITTTLTSAQLYLNQTLMVKPIGTTTRYLAEGAPWRYIRHPLRTYP